MDSYSSLKQVLETVGIATLRPKGLSMYPYIRQSYTIVIRKLIEKPKKYQCVIFRKNQNEYVLHRVIKVGENTFLPWGDNNLNPDGEIAIGEAIGYLEGYYKRKKYHKDKVTIFTKIGCLYPVRFVRIYFYRALRKIKKIFTKKNASA